MSRKRNLNMIESLNNSAAADHPDAALIALGRELGTAIEADDLLPETAPHDDLARACERVWQAIAAISALEAQSDAGLAVKARAVARAFAELRHVADDELADDERALASLVRSVFAGREMAA
jgi:hypothetical protein